MTRKMLFAAFLLTLVLTGIAMRHQLTNAAPHMAPPPKQAPPLEQYAARLAATTAPGDPVWQVVAGGGGKAYNLADVSMASPDEGWAVGTTGPSSYGVLMHYTNTTWSQVQAPTGTYAIYAVAMISPTEGWAVGYGAFCSWGLCDQGLLMHYTAATGWQTATVPARPDGNLWSGFYGIDIKGAIGWIVGENYFGSNNYFLQFDGTSWTPVTAPLQANDVSVIDANEAWAVGTNVSGTMQHWVNGSWSLVTPTLALPSISNVSLHSVHMLTATEGWAVGRVRLGTSPLDYSYQCLILHYDGSSWSHVACPSNNIVLHSVRMRTSTDVWAVGYTFLQAQGRSWIVGPAILHYNGSTWVSVSAPPGISTLSSVMLVGADDGWIVGGGGTILRLVNGSWTRMQGSSLPVPVGPLDSLAADEAWFGGNAGQLYRWKSGNIATYTSPVTTAISTLDMVSPTLGYMGTGRPYYDILRYSDGSWTKIATSAPVYGISMVSPNEGWFAVLNNMAHYNAGGWQNQYLSGASTSCSISMLDSNHGWAIGGIDSGVKIWKVYTYTSGVWSVITPSLTITSVAWGQEVVAVSPDEAWVAGYSYMCTVEGCPISPQLYHFSSGTWTAIPTPDWLAFFDISKVSATEWWAAGKLTTMEYAFLHYKDGTYTIVPSAGEDVSGVSMLPDGSGFARGVGSLLKLVFPVTTTVDPGTPTTLVYTDTSNLTTTVSVPAGAVTSTMTLVYTPLYTASAPGGFAFAGHAFALNAYSGTTLLPGFTFQQPVTITIHYSDADVARLDEDSLTLQYWTGSTWASDGITVIERNPAQNYVVFTITHLSDFALFGERVPERKVYLPIVIR